MKTMSFFRVRSTMAVAAVAMSVAFASCSKNDDVQPGEVQMHMLQVDGNGLSAFNHSVMLQGIDSTLPATDAEKANLLKLWNDEKLARDVYTVLGTKWSIDHMTRVATREDSHKTAVEFLMKIYGVAIPSGDAGTFADESVQNLYTSLVETGNQSLDEALKVGLRIEELDIAEIHAQLTQTSNANITLVYDNLVRASRNHLRAFARLLSANGGTYTPQYLSQDDYNQIVNSPNEKGKSFNKGNGKGKEHGKKGGKGNGNRQCAN